MEALTVSRTYDCLQLSHSFTRRVTDPSTFPSLSGSSPNTLAGPCSSDFTKQKGGHALVTPYGGLESCAFFTSKCRASAESYRHHKVDTGLISFFSVVRCAKRRELSARLAQLVRVKRAYGFGSRSKESSAKQICVSALGTRGPDCANDALGSKDKAATGDVQVVKGGGWNANQLVGSSGDPTSQFWEQLSIIFRVAYAVGLYGGLALASNMICNLTGMACWGGFKLSADVAIIGLGYAVPPMMILLFILDDVVVKYCPPARAIRDAEDEELMNFFLGMGPWQFLFVVIAGALSEELFFRVAVQGGLSHAIQMSGKGLNETPQGLSALTGIIPLFLPFAQIFAAVLSAALTGSMYYVISSPTDPTYVIAPTSGGRNTLTDIKKRFEVWYERRQLKKIYSPLMESLLALYLGFEWVQTGNILAPMITHTFYSLIVVGNGLRRINSQREKLRQRVSQVIGQQQEQIRD